MPCNYAYINTPYKKNKTFTALSKKFSEKKKKPILSYPGLRYAHKKLIFACKKIFGKCLFAYKFQFAVEKKDFGIISECQL